MGSPVRIVLVHGGFVDGSGWAGVYKILRKDGHESSSCRTRRSRSTTTSRSPGERSRRRAGRSFSSGTPTAAWWSPKPATIRGSPASSTSRPSLPIEASRSLRSSKIPPPGAPVPPILPPRDGFLFLDRARFAASFAADVDADTAAFMADSQVPWGVEALAGAVTEPAWKTKPSWYLVATDDRMIPPPAQRAMAQRAGSTVTEVAGSHSVYVSQPRAVATFIDGAARAIAERTK